MTEKDFPSQHVEQKAFIRSSQLDTMQAAPIHIDWGRSKKNTLVLQRTHLVSLIDFTLLTEIFENFLEVTGLPIAVIDLEGKVLASSKWQRLCMEFHRVHPKTLAGCLKSDTVLSQQMQEGAGYTIYQCANGLNDCAAPVIVDGVHVANLFTGQFLRATPDLGYFKQQQAANGFDEDAYFKALSEIPIVSDQKIPALLKLLKSLAQQIARHSLAEKRTLSVLADVERQVIERTRDIEERDQHFRALFEDSPHPQFIFDPENLVFRECNHAATKTYGYTLEELHKIRIAELDSVHDEKALLEYLRELKAKGHVRIESKIRRKDGDLRDVSGSAVYLRSAHGDSLHVTLVDVTEHKKAELAQATIGRAMRLLTECNEAVLHADDEFTLLNDICRLTVETGGYPLAWVAFMAPGQDKTFRPMAQFGLGKGGLEKISAFWACADFDRTIPGKAIQSGSAYVGQLSPKALQAVSQPIEKCQVGIAIPLIGQGGTLGGLMLWANEMGTFSAEEIQLLEKLASNLVFGIEGLRARMSLARANQGLQSFTYAASHDMKGPLGRIAAFSQLLEQQYSARLEGNGLKFIEFIRQNALRLTTLVEDLLTHSQVEQQSATLVPINLRAALNAILDEQFEDIAQHGAQVRISLPDVSVQGNPHALAQALRNLVSNAIKYSSQATPPLIEIGGIETEGRFCLQIKDNGIGFDMVYHDRIFEIFRRLHTYDEYAGNGVGLALVKKAVDSMGGKIWAESAPGQGATFFLELQLAF